MVMVPTLGVRVHVDVVQGGDGTLLRLPDTIPAPVVMVLPLVDTVRVDVVRHGDPTLVCLPDSAPVLT